ncbi:MAG TPA: MOSC domain-containing protein [Conexibacter sp.]|nr:MOSC domain-containing protein [Conexibacter sp.]
MPARVAWISFTPVKGLRLRPLKETEVTVDGIPGDRAFFLVAEDGTMVNAKRLGPLLTVVADHDADAGRLALCFPGGSEVAGAVELGDPLPVRFYGTTLQARPLRGEFSAALSEHVGVPLRLMAAPPQRSGVDRGREGAVTFLSTASLERLQSEAGASAPVDARRFRMTFGVEGVEAHAEDGWGDVRIGEALVRVCGNVGRCAITTRNADSGEVDFQTLHHLAAYRRDGIETTEPLPFGVHARVLEPGRVRVGDPVAPLR